MNLEPHTVEPAQGNKDAHHRREFVKKSAQGVALAAIPMVFNFNPMAAFASPDNGGDKLSAYFSHFGVDESVIHKVMADAMSKGGD